jgi:hypothetical protein
MYFQHEKNKYKSIMNSDEPSSPAKSPTRSPNRSPSPESPRKVPTKQSENLQIGKLLQPANIQTSAPSSPAKVNFLDKISTKLTSMELSPHRRQTEKHKMSHTNFFEEEPVLFRRRTDVPQQESDFFKDAKLATRLINIL